MAKRMLIDTAHPEETRVVVLDGNRLEEFDFETSTKKQIKGNIYLAKVTRVEPSLQAAFVEYGGNRHGFLAFSEIHPDYYRIPVADRQAALAADRAAERAADAREEAERDSGEPGGADLPPDTPSEIQEENGWTDDGEPDRMADAAPVEVRRGPAVDESEAAAVPETLAREPSNLPRIDIAEPATAAADAAESETPGGGDPTSEEPAADDAAESAPGEDAAGATEAADGDSIETVGGDAIEEATRPRARPFRHYKIQEVVKRRQIMLVQVTKEERGTKGAALTTYLSLAGRYCVLMPNTPRGGGVSRKITNNTDRRRLKDLVSDLDMPDGMGVIVRTAGSERSKTEIKRDFEYLLRLWDEIRELTLKSTAPALIYEEGNLIKRSIRDLYARDIEEVVVDGDEGYRTAKSFMRMLMPSHAKRVKPYRDPSVPLFLRFQVESQIDAIHSPTVQLRSGGYIVLNPTEALVAIDVNSGRSTRERNIEETALKTNIEAADEVARQLRLRDLAGLVVIDFIDMEEHRNQTAVERRVKEAMRSDRARIQLGRISPFGLLELSRQRLRPSILEASTQPCPHCNGSGHIRSTESTALHVLRAIEEEGMRRRSAEILVAVPTAVALYILNQKRATLQLAESRYGFRVSIGNDDSLVPPAFRLDRLRSLTPAEVAALPAMGPPPEEPEEDEDEAIEDEDAMPAAIETAAPARADADDEASPARRRHRRRGRRSDEAREAKPLPPAAAEPAPPLEADAAGPAQDDDSDGSQSRSDRPASESRSGEGDAAERKRRRRGRRGGRRRRRGGHGAEGGDGGEPVERSALPEAETIEYLPTAPDEETGVEEVIEAFSVSPAPASGVFSAESVPIAEHGDGMPVQPIAPEPAASQVAEPLPPEPTPAEAERAPAQYNAPPTHEVTGPPSNPRRGWWRH